MAMENPFEGKEIWFGVGSQDLYGEEALRQVAQQTGEMVDFLNATGKIQKGQLRERAVTPGTWDRLSRSVPGAA